MGEISHGDLQVIAESTEGFSGADLQALLYNAQVNKIHGNITIFWSYCPFSRHFGQISNIDLLALSLNPI